MRTSRSPKPSRDGQPRSPLGIPALARALVWLPLICGCAQALGLDETATLLGDGTTAGGGGAIASSAASMDASSATGGDVCPPCPMAKECEAAACAQGKCQVDAEVVGTPCMGGACDGAKHCVPMLCQDQAACGSSDYCGASACRPKKPANAPCAESFECISGNCQNQKCKP